MADETDGRKKSRDQLLEFKKVYANKRLHYKTSCRHYKRRLHVLTILSMVMTTVGVIVDGITMSPIVLGVISGIGVVIRLFLRTSFIGLMISLQTSEFCLSVEKLNGSSRG